VHEKKEISSYPPTGRLDPDPAALAYASLELAALEYRWPVRKNVIGARRCFPDLPQLYQRTRQVLMAHQARPIYAFHW
jgi:hypothetical protein